MSYSSSSSSTDDTVESNVETKLHEYSLPFDKLNFAPNIRLKKVGSDGRTKSAAAEGGYLFDDEEEIQKQRGSLWDVVKKIGSNLLEGKDLVSVSLPVYLFEPRSFVHRVCDTWATYHTLLVQAANETDPVKRFANVIAFSISGLHQTATALKPFNPILGETYEAEYVFGDDPSKHADVFVEQISHHPPITAWELISREGLFTYTGTAGYMGAVRGNALKGGQTGPHKISFKDGTTITYQLPLFWLKGVMWGDRIMEYYGVVNYTDEKNGLSCELTFHPDQQGWVKSFFKSAKTPSDTIRGEIKDANDKVVASIDGSWLGFVDLIYKNKTSRVWAIDKVEARYPKPKQNVLPSDARYRKDLQALIMGNLEEAQQWKEILEVKQRQEKKLRTLRKSSSSSMFSSGQVEE